MSDYKTSFMKRLLVLSAIISLVTISCNKPVSCDSNKSSLDGKWRMISVKENISGVTTTKPSSIAGEVDIVITTTSPAAGTFTGNTPTNSIWQNDFSLGANQAIAIPNLSMTKVTETYWGNEFVDNIRNAETYHLETAGKLLINTSSKTLSFRKL
jgi:hypothetical protein